MEMVFAQSGGHPIIHYHAIIFQHQPIAAPANGKLAPTICVNTVKEFSSIRAADVNFAKG